MLDRLGHGIFSNPFSPHLRHAVTEVRSPKEGKDTYSAIPVFLQVFLLLKDLSLLRFERSASNENFEESHTE